MAYNWRNENSSDMFADYDPCADPRPEKYNPGSTHSSTWHNSRGPRNNEKLDDQDSHVMYIDANKVGKLIGKGGSKIRELQEESGARISVSRTGTTSVPVTITGSTDAQQRAERSIDELLNDCPRTQEDTSMQSSERQGHKQQREEKQSNIDFDSFDWGKAAAEYEVRQKERWGKLPPIVKNFYKEDPAVANMSEDHAAHIRKINNNIEAKYVFEEGEAASEEMHVPNPIETFEQAFQHYPDIMAEIRKQGFQKPSPIQCQAWPILLSGKDLIGIAQTGTGKTLAFLLPALIHIDGQNIPKDKRGDPSVLILAPTRELALQIEKEVNKYSYRGIKAVCVYGGGNRREQMNVVSKGVEIVIATPGRLNDLIQTRVLSVSSITYLVLDEADRMLDMGFEPQIKCTLSEIRPDRITVMTSATWPQGVRRLAKSYMKNPIQVCVGSLDLAAVHTVTQKIYIVDEEEKLNMLYDFFREMAPDDKVIVFMGKKTRVDHIGSELPLKGIHCQSIHGGREQCDREQALSDLKTGDVRILLATDVASRGLDIEDISCVACLKF